MRAPLFWNNKSLLSAALLPAAFIYGGLAKVSKDGVEAKRVQARVICVGNAIVGGAGKTPVALAIGTLLKSLGKKAHYLSRGYKSDNVGVTLVDLEKHSAEDVGDEPLLLAEILPTWVSADRIAGAEAAVKAGAEVIIMDDGFQNPHLYKDISLLVVDGRYGFGNERLIPAGPLRESINDAMERATAVIMMGEDTHGVKRYVPQGTPILQAEIKPVSSADFLKNKQVVAFCGIANPDKFYQTLQNLGCQVIKQIPYTDHYHYQAKDIAFLRAVAKEHNAMLVTTEKDFVRLPDDMRAEVNVLPVEALFSDEKDVLGVVNF